MEINNNFNYQSKNKKLLFAFKRTLGMHLFRQRHKKRLKADKVCQALNIAPNILDKMELGRGNIRWDYITKLLDYYEAGMKLELYGKRKPRE